MINLDKSEFHDKSGGGYDKSGGSYDRGGGAYGGGGGGGYDRGGGGGGGSYGGGILCIIIIVCYCGSLCSARFLCLSLPLSSAFFFFSSSLCITVAAFPPLTHSLTLSLFLSPPSSSSSSFYSRSLPLLLSLSFSLCLSPYRLRRRGGRGLRRRRQRVWSRSGWLSWRYASLARSLSLLSVSVLSCPFECLFIMTLNAPDQSLLIDEKGLARKSISMG